MGLFLKVVYINICNMARYKKYIQKGVKESLSKVPFHSKFPFKRYLMLKNPHIAVHIVDKKISKKLDKYTQLHRHNYNEINLILSESDKLTYEIQLGGEVYQISSPATIFIPKGLKHSANLISGKGIFITIIGGRYRAQK